MAGMRDGHRNECKACNLAAKAARYRANPGPAVERAKRWHRENPGRYNANQRRMRASPEGKRRQRAGHLKRKFGITLEEYDETLADQDGCCAICGRKPGRISLHIDHEHRRVVSEEFCALMQ